ncbi:MAG: hypothetical protein WC705_00410 [Candidatus Paceibacterota bacterium]|jgi:5-bromo-4-chloroindolyl phosphate hydrolysis protein
MPLSEEIKNDLKQKEKVIKELYRSFVAKLNQLNNDEIITINDERNTRNKKPNK